MTIHVRLHNALLLLTTLGIRRWSLKVVALRTLLSVAQYFVGMIYWGSLASSS